MLHPVILLLIFCVYSAKASVTGYIGEKDESRFLEALTKAFIKPQETDYSSAYYGIRGFKLLNKPLVTVLVMDTCGHLEKNFKKGSGPEQSFHAVTAWSLLGCTGKLHTDVTVKTLKAALEDSKSSVADIRYAAEALQTLNEKIPNPQKVAQLIQTKLKEDDSLQNLGQALHLAVLLGPSGKFMLDRVEDIIVQADEVDGKMLQWEGGLTTTGLLLTGILKLQGAQQLTQVQADKFGYYLLSRKTVQSPRGLVALLESVQALVLSPVSPVSFTVIGSPYVTVEKPDLKIQISNLLGKPFKPIPTPVIAQSATRIADEVVVLSKQPLTPGSSQTEFILSLRVEPGQYKISLTAGSHSVSLTARVLGPVNLDSIEIGVGDADGTSAPRFTKLARPNHLQESLQADSTQHLFIRFNLPRPVHQAFVKLSSGKKEIIFVAEKDSSKMYKVEVNLSSELVYSGSYEIELIIGDSVMSNSLRWVLGVIEAKLSPPLPDKAGSRGVKPEIKHLFRPADKRPPQVVSMFFSALAAAPLLLLLILWGKIGVNIGNFTIAAIPFHAGFGAILGLFVLFWLKLDMFTTCTLLLPVGGFTFLAGNRFLSKLAKERKH